MLGLRRSVTAHDVATFVATTASALPTPGGGSCVALAGAMAAALVEKVARKSRGRAARTIQRQAGAFRQQLTRAIHADATAYGRVARALRQRRPRHVVPALRRAIQVPEQVAATARRVVRLVRRLTPLSSAVWRSDLTCAIQLAHASIAGSRALAHANRQYLRTWLRRR